MGTRHMVFARLCSGSKCSGNAGRLSSRWRCSGTLGPQAGAGRTPQGSYRGYARDRKPSPPRPSHHTGPASRMGRHSVPGGEVVLATALALAPSGLPRRWYSLPSPRSSGGAQRRPLYPVLDNTLGDADNPQAGRAVIPLFAGIIDHVFDEAYCASL